jgi:serine/threonine protein kinase
MLDETASLEGLEEARAAMARVRSDASYSLSQTLCPVDDDNEDQPLLGSGDVVEGYEVRALVGTGGMAEVYRVVRDGNTYALKLLTIAGSSVRERLMREARTMSAMRHPNVVALEDVIDTPHGPGLVLEYVAGPSLHGLLEHHLSMDQVDALALDILDGVAACHSSGLVHRDLKPANILIQPVDDRLVAKVADFGLVKVLGGDQGTLRTRTGATAGTPAYMAPEQIRDASRVDVRADVFSLGAVLYELATGRRAFDGLGVLDVFERIQAGQHGPVDELPERMQRAITGALQADRDARLADVDALRAAWGGTRGATFSAELQRWAREHAQHSQRITVPSAPRTPQTTFDLDDPMLGRADLIDRARRALAAGRPLTIVGPPGSGRSTLAHELGGGVVALAARGWLGEEVIELGPLHPSVAAALFDRLGGRGARHPDACLLPLAVVLDAAQPTRLSGQTMDDVLLEVWGRLDADMRAALGKCSELDGPFTLEQAEQVVDSTEWVLDLLQEAAELALLRFDQPRFSMPSAVAAFVRSGQTA